ncbi:MAG: metalloregulator ArsR/SmtB family transcription factor [Eubacteriales bacterium]|nr:metalloregulator ArsR/SmtB family transcription factor [Eubacteriales bacterium]
MDREKAIKLFKCLSDSSRLRILQALCEGDMYTELLAERLELTPSTVSFHMKKLEEAGLVTSRRDQYYTLYSIEPEILGKRLSELIAAEDGQMDEQKSREDEYRRKVIGAFFDGTRLISIPVQRKKRLICYEKIAEMFETGREYSEKELDDIILRVHEDYCTIRRDMIGEGILSRDGATYVRVR